MKKIALIALLLVAALALTACGGSNPSTFAEANTDKLVTMGEYKDITYTPTAVTVSDYEVQVAINNALNEKGYAKSESGLKIEKGTVQLGDVVNIDYKGLKDGVAFDGGTAAGQSLTIGSGQFIAGFEEGLVGKAIGSDVKLNLTFPEDYGSADLAGQAVIFEVKINYVTTRVTYSELTDAVAKELNSETATAKDYKENVKTTLENNKKESAKADDEAVLWGKVVENCSYKNLPKKLVKMCKEEFTQYFEYIAKQNSFTSLEEFIKGQGWTEAFFNEQAQLNAENTVKTQLTAYAIAKAEGFEVTDKVFEESVKKYAADAGYSDADKYIAAVGSDAIKDQIVLDYAMDLVITNAKVK